MTTLTPSMLDAWSLFQADVIDAEDMRNRLLRVKAPRTEKMAIGVAYELMIQGASPADNGDLVFDVKSASEFGILGYRHLEFEVPGTLDCGEFILSGRVDGLGDEVHEFKAVSQNKDYKDFYTSPQWKCYSIMFNRKVIYHAIRYKKQGNKIITLGVSDFDFCAGPETENEIIALGLEVFEYAKAIGVEIR